MLVVLTASGVSAQQNNVRRNTKHEWTTVNGVKGPPLIPPLLDIKISPWYPPI